MIRIERTNFNDLSRRHIAYFEKYLEPRLDWALESTQVEEHKGLLSFLHVKRNEILTGRPDVLEALRVEITERYFKLMLSLEKIKVNKLMFAAIAKETPDKYNNPEGIAELGKVSSLERLRAHLERVFDYEHFVVGTNGKINWGAYQLVTGLQVDVCPYCNRQYTYTYEGTKDERGKTRPQLDHFYIKSRYPYFALSLFNLIPCCVVCNSNLKHDLEFSYNTHLHPYAEDGEFGDRVRFRVTFPKGRIIEVHDGEELKQVKRDYLSAWLNDPEQYRLVFAVNIDPSRLKSEQERNDDAAYLRKVRNNRNVFKLRQLYNAHKDYVQELITKSIVYSEAGIAELMTTFPDLFQERNDVMRMITGNYIAPEDLNKRVLAKLTRDIWSDFGLGLE